MSSTDTVARALSDEQRETLLGVARLAILHRAKHGVAFTPDATVHDDALQAVRACFVTLHKEGALRGCVGTLRARNPLITEVAQSAVSAAFKDPRFPQVNEAEVPSLDVHISVLSPPEDLEITGENDLLEKMRPGVDGLILRDGAHMGTFLPSVWESLPEPALFLQQLKRKAGLPVDHWSDTVRIQRYTTESFPDSH